MTYASSLLPSSRGWFYPLDYKRGPADTPDDDFRSATLDAKWTVVSGSSGTVSLAETGDVAKYDLQSRPGWLLIQAGQDGAQSVEFRQDWTMADGESIVIAIGPTVTITETATANPPFAIGNNDVQVGISLNTSDLTPETNPRATFYAIETDTGEWAVDWQVYNGAGTQQAIAENPYKLGSMLFLRIARVGSTYYGFWSSDGFTWVPFGGGNPGAELTDLWLFMQNDAAANDPVPIHAIKWVRQGTNDYDPWPLIA